MSVLVHYVSVSKPQLTWVLPLFLCFNKKINDNLHNRMNWFLYQGFPPINNNIQCLVSFYRGDSDTNPPI